MDKPIPVFDVDEIINKAERENWPPFYLVYGWLIANGYCSFDGSDYKLGINLPSIKFNRSEDRSKNLRIITIFDETLEMHIKFEGKGSVVDNDYMYGNEEDKIRKYLNYLPPFE